MIKILAPNLYEWTGDGPPSLEDTKQILTQAHVTMVTLPNGDQLLVDEEGSLKSLPENPDATALVLADGGPRMLAAFGGVVVGPALLLRGKGRWT